MHDDAEQRQIIADEGLDFDELDRLAQQAQAPEVADPTLGLLARAPGWFPR